MTVTFNSDTIGLITFFENLTGAKVKDCVIDEETNTVYFLIEEGYIGLAIGKNGTSVRNAEEMLKKKIKLIEFSQDMHKFVKNTIPKANDVVIKNEGEKVVVEIKVEKNDKAAVIGRDGKRLNIAREILRRNYKIDELIVK
jgi:N utilization substance protein A